MRILILGGTGEARALAERLAADPRHAVMLSLAGRTRDPAPQPVPVRVGGFGGVDGLAAHLVASGTDRLIDATHPFAEQISRHAAEAARRAGVPLAVLSRPPWTAVPGDRWIEVPDLSAAAAALGPDPCRVLVTVGRLGLAAFAVAPQHHYVVRSIDDPGDLAALGLPDGRLILHRPPFDVDAEAALMASAHIDVLVTKNSGGPSTYGKIAAARRLGLPVVMVRPPQRPAVPTFHAIDALIAWLEDGHVASAAERGV